MNGSREMTKPVCDYVFRAKDYSIPTISKIRQYLEENSGIEVAYEGRMEYRIGYVSYWIDYR